MSLREPIVEDVDVDSAEDPPAPHEAAAPPPPPAAPSGLTANGVSETAIDLAWMDNATTETGFRVERSDAGTDSYSVVANLGVNANSYTDNGLIEGGMA